MCLGATWPVSVPGGSFSAGRVGVSGFCHALPSLFEAMGLIMLQNNFSIRVLSDSLGTGGGGGQVPDSSL